MSKISKLVSRVMASPMFGRYLIVTNTITGGVFLTAGDAVIQKAENYSKAPKVAAPLDLNRSGRMLLIGLGQGLFGHGWYHILDKFYVGKTAKIITQKVILDQIIGSPFFAYYFIVGMALLEGESRKDAVAEFKRKFWTIYKADWMVWPPAQIINFYFLPSQFRLIYVSTVTLGWDMFLSYAKHTNINAEEKEAPAVMQKPMTSISQISSVKSKLSEEIS